MASNAASRPDREGAPGASAAAERWKLDQRARTARFEELFLPYLDNAYDLARWLARDPHDAEDVVQEAYLRALRFFDPAKVTNPHAWILTVVRNTFYTWAGARRARAEEPLAAGSADDSEIELWDPAQETPETALTRKTEDAAMRSLIEALPPPFREALVLREMEELSYQEIAGIADVPIGTVMSRLSRARGLLRSAWTKYQERGRVR